ncbi:MAG: TiaS agmantine-binding domain-containing protein, partial [Thermoplasmata archaeon]
MGIDDTDSPRGGCTTWALTELIAEARSLGVDLIGEPRLVRLNPNIPWKTRGNAALAGRFGVGRGRRRRIGVVERRPVWSFAHGDALPDGRGAEWIDRAWRRLLSSARLGEPGTDPALVAVERPLPAALYWNAVQEVVDVSTLRPVLERAGAVVRTSGSDRGLVGASAAIAWREARPTWELIAYRLREREGSARVVDPESVHRARARLPELFLCEDPATRRLLVAPHTPCPILFGLRGTRPEAPLAARRLVRSEPVDRWLLFRTNQASGDHLVRRTASAVLPFRSAILTGTVGGPPENLAGGHVRLTLTDATGTALTCLVFEPTKTLPRVARALRSGDAVRIWGSRAEDPVFRVEGIELLSTAARSSRPRPPACSSCRRSTDSLGHLRGYRCPTCHRRWPPEAASVAKVPGELAVGV